MAARSVSDGSCGNTGKDGTFGISFQDNSFSAGFGSIV